MSDTDDIRLDRLLKSYVSPPASAGLARRIVAEAARRDRQSMASIKLRSGGAARRPWARRRWLVAIVALNLAVAAAAAGAIGLGHVSLARLAALPAMFFHREATAGNRPMRPPVHGAVKTSPVRPAMAPSGLAVSAVEPTPPESHAAAGRERTVPPPVVFANRHGSSIRPLRALLHDHPPGKPLAGRGHLLGPTHRAHAPRADRAKGMSPRTKTAQAGLPDGSMNAALLNRREVDRLREADRLRESEVRARTEGEVAPMHERADRLSNEQAARRFAAGNQARGAMGEPGRRRPPNERRRRGAFRRRLAD